MENQFKLLLTTVVLLTQRAVAQTCTFQHGIGNNNPENLVNQQFRSSFTFTKGLNQPINEIRITIPGYFGITEGSSFSCQANVKPEDAPLMFLNGIPLCSQQTNPTATVITIKDLNENSPKFDVYFKPNSLKNGGVAKKNIKSLVGGIICESYLTDNVSPIERTFVGNDFEIKPDQCVTGQNYPSMTSDPSMNSKNAKLKITIPFQQLIPAQGTVILNLPKNNIDYKDLGGSPSSYIQTLPLVITNIQVSYLFNYPQGAEVVYEKGVSFDSKDTIKISLKNPAVIQTSLNIEISSLKLAGSLKTQKIEVITGDKDFDPVFKCSEIPLTNIEPAGDLSSTVTIDGSKTANTKGNTYIFTINTIGDIPQGGIFTLQIPDKQIGIDISTLVFKCITNCADKQAPSWDSSTNTLTFLFVYPFSSDYLIGGSQIRFSLSPIQNAPTTTPQKFIWRSFAVLEQRYQIDEIKNLQVTAEAAAGPCTITALYPTDNNKQIYGVASSWNWQLYCSNDILPTYSLVITFPKPINPEHAKFNVVDTARCNVGLLNPNFQCLASSFTNTITISSFTIERIPAKRRFQFTVNSIQNPGWYSMPEPIQIGTFTGTTFIDYGYYTIPDNYFTSGFVKNFLVIPQNFQVGNFPSFYQFFIQPSGEVWRNSYFLITYPQELEIMDKNAIESKCNYNVTGFDLNSNNINCKIVNSTTISIYNVFLFKNTTNMTAQNLMTPPTFSFSLPSFRNPGTLAPTGAFNVAVVDQYGNYIYSWNQRNPTYSYTNNGVPFSNSSGVFAGPVVQMKLPASPKNFLVQPGSFVAGNVTYYDFIITSTNYLREGSSITITLPNQMFFNLNSTCTGLSTNLRVIQPCKSSPDLQSVTINLKLPIPELRMLQYAISRQSIKPQESFKLRISDIKNPTSTKPTFSIGYYVYDSKQTLFELQNQRLNITMKQPGLFDPLQSSIIPSDFRQSFVANYSLKFTAVNYQQNMQVALTLPKEVDFASNKTICFGKQGTSAQQINCTQDPIKKVIRISDAFAYQAGNPGPVEFIFQSFKNPTQQVVTSSFKLQTFTSDGFALDQNLENLTVNFYCSYPCKTCNLLRPEQCYSCYGGNALFSKYFNFTCFDVCPTGYVDTITNNCTKCLFPCTQCKDTPTNCTNCTVNYELISDGTCRQLVYWPFPFFCLGFIMFVVIVGSEIKNKAESKFKRAFVALLSIPEILSWGTFVPFLYYNSGVSTSFYLAIFALVVYIMINFIYACIHPRYVVPMSDITYKQLTVNHRSNTYFVYFISTVFSFKFSLILVSHLCSNPKLKGDYTQANWATYNKVALVYLLLSFPLMISSCSIFLVNQGMFSYAGYLCLEVLILSSILAVIMLIDVIKVFRCNVQTQTKKQINVQRGYESDDDDQHMRKVLRRRAKQDGEEFGADENVDSTYAGLHHRRQDPETLKQIEMLEDLAKQMKKEREFLRLEKEKIEREKIRIIGDKTEQMARMNAYINDFNKKPKQVVQTKQGYTDVEKEMENYDPIDEELWEQDEIKDTAQLPIAIQFGQINYIKNGDRDDQFFLQQTQALAAQLRYENSYSGVEEQIHMNRNLTARYEDETLRNTIRTKENYVERDDASYSQFGRNRITQRSEEYRQTVDAEMDKDSNRAPRLTGQQFFQNEHAVFGDEGVRKVINIQQNFIGMDEADHGILDDIISKHGSEKMYIEQEEAAVGSATGRKTQFSEQNQNFVNRELARFEQNSVQDRQATPQQYFKRDRAEYEQNSEQARLATPQEYFKRAKPNVGDATDRVRMSANNQAFINQDRASQGLQSEINRDGDDLIRIEQEQALVSELGSFRGNGSTQLGFEMTQAQFAKIQDRKQNAYMQMLMSPEFGTQKKEIQQNFTPEPVEVVDQSGKSESSEGIVDHVPFNRQQVKQIEQVQNRIQSSKKNFKSKTLVFLDKSESSVDEMMDDTPSNYNVPNGRLEGKSLGLKSILIQRQKVDKSVDGGWGLINQNFDATKNTPVIQEEVDEPVDGLIKRKKKVKSNKQYANEPNFLTQKLNSDLEKVKKNNFV